MVAAPVSFATTSAKFLFAAVLATPPTANVDCLLEQGTREVINPPPIHSTYQPSLLADLSYGTYSTSTSDSSAFFPTSRQTTPIEIAVSQLREWRHLNENHDGERARAPDMASLIDAESFVRAWLDLSLAPEPMLFANGRAGLFWDERGVYADLEFHGKGRLSYFVKVTGGNPDHAPETHRGVMQLHADRAPEIIAQLMNIATA